jgi:hypothetical protein
MKSWEGKGRELGERGGRGSFYSDGGETSRGADVVDLR